MAPYFRFNIPCAITTTTTSTTTTTTTGAYLVQDAYIQTCNLNVCADGTLYTISTKSALTVGNYYYDSTYGTFRVVSSRYSTNTPPSFTLVVTDVSSNPDFYCCI